MFTIPDKGEGLSVLQSIFFQEYIDGLIEGLNGINCVLSGFDDTDNGTMVISLAKGSVISNSVLRAVAAGNATIGSADPTDPRIDLIVIDSSGTIQVRAGTASSTPKPPARTANDVILYSVYVPAGISVITVSHLTDLRILRDRNICIYKTTAAETTNTTASAVHVLNKAASGVVIPDGLFLAGKMLHVKIGGNYLLNSGTPTLTLVIAYGGTTLFQDVTGAATADTDRGAWNLDFILNAQANNDQALSGIFRSSPLGAKTAPTTGIGDIALTADVGSPIGGAAAVDSNAANRTLSVTLTMSVSNVANEIVTEYAMINLI